MIFKSLEDKVNRLFENSKVRGTIMTMYVLATGSFLAYINGKAASIIYTIVSNPDERNLANYIAMGVIVYGNLTFNAIGVYGCKGFFDIYYRRNNREPF